jgi:helix-turn-helix protein
MGNRLRQEVEDAVAGDLFPMEEKTRFIAAVLTAEESIAELCAEFGISRKTGYKWLARYQAGGPGGLYELLRAPQRVPWAIKRGPGRGDRRGAPRSEPEIRG